jgi:hypothetical protein
MELAFQAIQAKQSAELCPMANFMHQDVDNNLSGRGLERIVH